MKILAVFGIFLATGLSAPFVVFRAENSPWMPVVLIGFLLACMIALAPNRKDRERRASLKE